MALERYNAPVVRGFLDQLFNLDRTYQSTRQAIAQIYDSAPAGVVEEEIDPKQRKTKVAGYIADLEEALITFERNVPQDVASQRDIAELLSNVREFVYSE